MALWWWTRIRQRLAREKADHARQRWAIEAALAHFATSRGIAPMGAHVLSESPDEVVVRVMFLTNHIPPDRAWYAIPVGGGVPRELSYEEVRPFETTVWR